MPTRNIFFILCNRNSLFHLGVLSHTSCWQSGILSSTSPVFCSNIKLINLGHSSSKNLSGTCRPLRRLAATLLFLGHIWMPKDELVEETLVSDLLAEVAAECHEFPVRH